MAHTNSSLFIGLMSGTSMDGVDGVLASIGSEPTRITTLAAAHRPFPDELRAALMALQAPGENEIHRESLAADALARLYAQCVADLLDEAGVSAAQVCAIGVHGQTIRHQPGAGYTRQTNNPALLAELAGIDVIADFRSRDIAAGGQGAPLVPAFHHAMFADPAQAIVLANIGGIANISILDPASDSAAGFDTGPGNALMDGWIFRHRGRHYDDQGSWAASGRVDAALLQALLDEPYLALPPPKSTGRDLFHADWLAARLGPFGMLAPVDVQATLARYTAVTLAEAIHRHAPAARAVYVCGGGAFNTHLLDELGAALAQLKQPVAIAATDALGMAAQHVEALAFAWLAQRFVARLPGNLPAVTGARGPRIMGALYPA
ncbi:anhydro-N-acetylmuramic acid kinase [Noviherbaspirillum sp. 1P10PC]|uniref:anhydro-N-acetylmuramic acid kinase n=1 Tax=Noviherbaspirillum sp. 1P10PC TaxID=3132292 RepID=UPI00399F1F89